MQTLSSPNPLGNCARTGEVRIAVECGIQESLGQTVHLQVQERGSCLAQGCQTAAEDEQGVAAEGIRRPSIIQAKPM
jgi:hypothetical protein